MLRECSSQTDATETKSIFSFETTQELGRFVSSSLGDRSSAEQQPRLRLLCMFPWGSQAAPARFHGVLPALWQGEESFPGCPEESARLCRAPRPSLHLPGSMGALSMSGNNKRVEKQPGAGGTGLALVEL